MAEKIIMPKTGMAMEEGIIIEWFKNEGDLIKKGDVVAEIETDKSTMELESDYDGTLLKILYPAGTTVPVVKTIAWIGEPGETLPEEEAPLAVEAEATSDAPGSEASSSADRSTTVAAVTGANQTLNDADMIGDRVRATPAARRISGERGISLTEVKPSGNYGEVREKDVLTAKKTAVTPLAAKIAADKGISLNAVSGTGHGSKIFKSDLSLMKNISKTIPEDFAPDYEDKYVDLTGIQKITGKRMFQSHSEIPVVTENTKADVTELLSMRKSLNTSLDGSISINDFVMLATARALRLNPRMNASLDGTRLLYKGRINLGMAVATPRGLLVPVIKDADMYSISGFSAAAKEVADKGRAGKLQAEDMEGGTFTVSNVGMFGITAFTPIINQPEAGIMGVCAIEDQLKMIDGEIVNRKIMGLSLTFDHRVVDGAEAAVFIKTVKDFLEAPLTILA
ncbi:MAG: 2-oxo acid dehydrogenase subunit E2 [Spirochaetales bacterium]|nr:2-oxo acid dehydrogenase subunit E2 [Spirochaetales bacterium]